MDSQKSWIIITLLALVLSMVVRYQTQQLNSDEPIEMYYESDDVNINSNNVEDQGKRVMHKSRDAAIFELENDREMLRRSKLNPLLDESARASSRVNAIRSSQSWFPSASEKASLQAAQEAAADANKRLTVVQNQERALVSRLKPLYGLVSSEFFDEQKGAVRESLRTVSKLAYDNAWWHSLFNLGRAESLTDVLLEFALQYVIIYSLAYPFAFLYFVLYFAPTTIYSYCGSIWDVPSAILMYVIWSLVMAIPGLLLFYGVKFLLRYVEHQQRQRRDGGGQAFRQADRIFRGRQY